MRVCLGAPTLTEYTVTALSRCTLLSITRGELKTILTTYEEDKEVRAACGKARVRVRVGVCSVWRSTRAGGGAHRVLRASSPPN